MILAPMSLLIIAPSVEYPNHSSEDNMQMPIAGDYSHVSGSSQEDNQA